MCFTGARPSYTAFPDHRQRTGAQVEQPVQGAEPLWDASMAEQLSSLPDIGCPISPLFNLPTIYSLNTSFRQLSTLGGEGMLL